MDSLVPKVVRKLLKHNNFKIIPDMPGIDDLTCSICNNIMTDAYQSYCGCVYCFECITNYLSSGQSHCIGDKEYCKDQPIILDKNVLRSALLNNKILRLKVICPNHACDYSSDMTNMEDHLRVCTKQSMECPYNAIGCADDVVSRETLETHINVDLLKHSQLLMDWIDHFKNEFDTSKLMVDTLKAESRFKEGEIQRLTVDIELLKNGFIEYKARIETLEGDSENQKNQIETLMNEVNDKENRIVTLEKEDSLKETRILKLEEISQDNERRIGTLELESSNKDARILELEEKSRSDEYRIETLTVESRRKTTRMINLEKDLKKKEERLSQLEVKMIVYDDESMKENIHSIEYLTETVNALNIGTNTMVMIGSMNFTITDLETKISAMEVHPSSYFYSHSNGYKFRMLVYPGGIKDGNGTHLSVFIEICNGEYDHLLTWPCRYSMNFSIMNQLTGEAHITLALNYSTTPDKLKSSFSKPHDDENQGFGFPTFISHKDLRSTDFLIVNDSIIIECAISPPK